MADDLARTKAERDADFDRRYLHPKPERRAPQPIRVFFSKLSRRFYATRAYRIDAATGVVEVTGEKFDVTNDIANLIAEHHVEFVERK
jgi:hypothetical protein